MEIISKAIATEFKKLVKEALVEHAEEQKGSTTPKKELGTDKFLTRKQTCQQLHITLPTLNKYVKDGIIKSHRLGGRVLFIPEDVENALIARNFKFKK